jgi:hypothetical protein
MSFLKNLIALSVLSASLFLSVSAQAAITMTSGGQIKPGSPGLGEFSTRPGVDTLDFNTDPIGSWPGTVGPGPTNKTYTLPSGLIATYIKRQFVSYSHMPQTGVYPQFAPFDTSPVISGPYEIRLSTPQTYFGMYWTSNDGTENKISFYRGEKLIAAFDGSQVKGGQIKSDYVYVNFDATQGDEFDRIVIQADRFETDNHAFLGNQRLICRENLVLNGDVTQNTGTGNLGMPVTAADWLVYSQTPQLVSTMGDGNNGFFAMWGNAVVGEAIQQKWGTTKLRKGRRYRMTISVKQGAPSKIPYAWLRVRASRGSVASYVAKPPAPGVEQTVAIIGKTPSIPAAPTPGINHQGWVNYQVEWISDGDYDTLTLNPENESSINNGDLVSWAWVDNICIIELPRRNIGDVKTEILTNIKDKFIKEVQPPSN